MTWSIAWNYAGESGEVDGIDVQWTESLALERAIAGFRQASVSFLLPLDLHAIAVRFHPLRGFASLRFSGSEVIAGRWRDVSYEPTGDGRTVLSITVSQSDEDDRGVFPPLSAWRPQRNPGEIVDYGQPRAATSWDIANKAGDDGLIWITDPNARWDTPGRNPDTLVRDPLLRKDLWPNIAAPAEGASWPYPVGRPGRGTTLPAVPAYMIDETGDPKILIAGTQIAAPTVTVFGPATAGGSGLTYDEDVPVNHAIDATGFVYAYVLASDLTNVNADPVNTFYWSSPDNDTTPGGAGDLLLDIASASTLPVHVREFRRLAGRLNAYRFDGYFDVSARPMDLLRDQLLPLLPVSLVPTRYGLAPVLLPFLDDREARGPDVVDGTGVAVEGPISYQPIGGASAATLRYAYRADKQHAAKVARASASTSLWSRYAAVGAYDEAEGRLVWDPTTAGVMVADAVRAAAWTPRVVSLAVTDAALFGPAGTEPLQPGARVTFTSARLALDHVAAVIGGSEHSADRTLVRLWLLDDPLAV